SAVVGDSVDFSYTVSNPGPVDLTDLQVESELPGGLNVMSVTSAGAVDPDTGFVQWAFEGGLAAGASTQMHVAVTIASPGEWTNNACTAGLDALGNVARDCASSTVFGAVLTMTPTPTPTSTPTSTQTVISTVTPVPPAPVQP